MYALALASKERLCHAVAQPGGAKGAVPPPKYLCNYGPLQVKGPL